MSVSPRSLSLFISYSHNDEPRRAELERHLSLLKRQNVFDIWHDRRLSPGEQWARTIDDALELADVIVLLVSSDFIASDYCYGVELKRALERHRERTARVIPIILRPCDWKSSPFGALHALPSNGKPVISYEHSDSAWLEVTAALRRLADELRGDRARVTAGEEHDAAPTPTQVRSPAPAHKGWRKLKTGAPMEWPQLRPIYVTGAILVGLVIAIALVYSLTVKPPLGRAHELMRRGEYSNANAAIASVPHWLRWLPRVASLLAQSEFGARLQTGEHIRTLGPELAELNSRYPDETDVQLFVATHSYFVDGNLQAAADLSLNAVQHDPEHLEARYFAAARQIDLAYVAIDGGNQAQRLEHAEAARRLLEEAVQRYPFATSTPRYANEVASLDELDGHDHAAYVIYSRLAPLYANSAVQALFVSWRLDDPATAIAHSLEDAQTTLSRMSNDARVSPEFEGWLFRTSSTEFIDVHSRTDKECLLAEAIEASTALIRGSETNPDEGKRPITAAHCVQPAATSRVTEIVCFELSTALRIVPASDSRTGWVRSWKSDHLHCSSPGANHN